MGGLCCSGDRIPVSTMTNDSDPSSAKYLAFPGFPHYNHQVVSSESAYLSYFSPPSYRAVPNGACGLENLGNTCFINSALQCLAAVPVLTDYCLSAAFKHDVNLKNKFGSHGAIITLFVALLQERWKQGLQVSRPTELVSYIWKHSHFSPRSQNDSQEFLAYFLDQLHEDLNRNASRPKSPSKKVPNDLSDDALAELAWQSHLQRNSSFVVDTFQGLLKSSLTCLRCSHTSVTFEPFMFLSLPMPQRRSGSLQECLTEFTKAERLEDGERWTCPKCAEPVEAVKKLDIWKVPPVLVVHLKRFYCQRESMGKLTNTISYPTTGLTISDFVRGPGKVSVYHLISRINHVGSITSGHYTATALHAGIWLEYDDERCYPAETSAQQNTSAYVLVFASQDAVDSRSIDSSTSISSCTTMIE